MMLCYFMGVKIVRKTPQRSLTFRALHDAVLLDGGMGVKIVRKTPQRLLTFRALHDAVLLHGVMGG